MNQPSGNSTSISPLFTSEVFLLALVLGCFLVGIYVYKRTRISLLQPILTAVIILIPFLKLTGISYEVFSQQTNLLNLMLGPCVVALGYVMYEELEQIRGNVLSIFTAVFVGSAVAIVSVVLIAKLFGADSTLLASLAPKSVTTPIAISLAGKNGGIPSLAVAFVVICGIFGGMVGPVVLRALGVKSKVAKGLALGAASHAMGTARAIEMGATEGAISGLAICIMGVFTAMLMPLLLSAFN